MLFKCAYGATQLRLNSPYASNNMGGNITLGFHNHMRIYDLEESFKSWGKDKVYQPTGNRFLVDIPNRLVFNLLLEDNLPKEPTVYVDFIDKKIYFCNNPTDLNYLHNSWSSARSSLKTTFFEWEVDEEVDESKFCYEVPDEDYQEIYDIIEPYIIHDFNYKIKRVIDSFPDHRGNTLKDMMLNLTSSLLTSSNTEEVFKINSSTEFWKFLIHDVFNGKFTAAYEQRFPRTVDKLRSHMARFHSHVLSTGNHDYDPFAKDTE